MAIEDLYKPKNPARLVGGRLLPVMLPKKALVKGAYYVGLCRNTTVARWDGEQFHHWRRKWGNDFVETIKHPEDDEVFDVFVPVARCDGHEIRPVPIEGLDDFQVFDGI